MSKDYTQLALIMKRKCLNGSIVFFFGASYYKNTLTCVPSSKYFIFLRDSLLSFTYTIAMYCKLNLVHHL